MNVITKFNAHYAPSNSSERYAIQYHVLDFCGGMSQILYHFGSVQFVVPTILSSTTLIIKFTGVYQKQIYIYIYIELPDVYFTQFTEIYKLCTTLQHPEPRLVTLVTTGTAITTTTNTDLTDLGGADATMCTMEWGLEAQSGPQISTA